MSNLPRATQVTRGRAGIHTQSWPAAESRVCLRQPHSHADTHTTHIHTPHIQTQPHTYTHIYTHHTQIHTYTHTHTYPTDRHTDTTQTHTPHAHPQQSGD